jgi:hypothetical protein
MAIIDDSLTSANITAFTPDIFPVRIETGKGGRDGAFDFAATKLPGW